MSNVLLNQDLDYYQSLLTDQLKDVKFERSKQRTLVESKLKSKIPNSVERLLNREQAGLYRLYQSVPNQLTTEERIRGQNITNYLEHLKIGCYNLSSEQETILREHNRLFTFNIPNVKVSFCIDVAGPIQNELVNSTYKMVDVFIEQELYPLDEITSIQYLEHLRRLNVDPTAFPQMKVTKVENTQTIIENIMLQLYPESIL
jgi:hypothetical protein